MEDIKFKKMISLKDVENIQKEWGDSLVKLGSLKMEILKPAKTKLKV